MHLPDEKYVLDYVLRSLETLQEVESAWNLYDNAIEGLRATGSDPEIISVLEWANTSLVLTSIDGAIARCLEAVRLYRGLGSCKHARNRRRRS